MIIDYFDFIFVIAAVVKENAFVFERGFEKILGFLNKELFL